MLLGVDIGGTFTDLVWWTGSELRTAKVPTTPGRPDDGMLAGIEALGANAAGILVVHGSTIATNAFLERKGARVTLLTTAGFADVLEIGRQHRLGIYQARAVKPEPLVPPERRLEVRERLDAEGHPLVPLTDDEVRRVVEATLAQQPEAVAINLLHAYANPAHEQALLAALRQALRFVYASCEVDPTYREFERTSTTVLNAYVAPLVADYVDRLRARLRGPLLLMGSDGGRQADTMLARPASMILSGPAGGVVGARAVAELVGERDIITLDMGGTSTDVTLIPGRILTTRESLLEGLPLRAPMLDIHTVGAGGGSLIRFDRGGALVVGPESAGADPGPACYGRGGSGFTVTDAHVLLGHLVPDYFLGGHMTLDREAAERAARATLAGQLTDVVELAEGAIAVANATMERAVRTVSARRGYDPAQFVLLCFGGAGGLHAVRLAQALGMRGVLVPRHAGVLSALGMTLAHTQVTHQASILRAATELDGAELLALAGRLAAQGRTALGLRPAGEDGAAPAHDVHLLLDLRYRGQSYELPIPWQESMAATVAAFHQEHGQRFGYTDPQRVVEVVNASVTVRELNAGFALPEIAVGAPAEPRGRVQAWFEGRAAETPVYQMEELAPGQTLNGPAIIAAAHATVLVPPGVVAHVDRYGNIRVQL
jgi:N-methylhydantoinase A